jgi:hypothetical protein
MRWAVLEKNIERYLRERAKGIGAMPFKFVSPSQCHVPDQLILLRDSGGVVFVEVKQEKGRLTQGQRIMHDLIRAQGYPVYVVWSKGDVDELIERLDLSD